jgi:hypothetical protein
MGKIIQLLFSIIGKAPKIGSGAKIASYSKTLLSKFKSLFVKKGKKVSETGLSTVLADTVQSFGAKEASSLSRSAIFKMLSGRAKALISNKTFRELIYVGGGTLAIDYLIDNFDMDPNEAKAVVAEFINYGVPTDFISPFNVDSSDDLKKLEIVRMNRHLNELIGFRVGDDSEARSRVVANMMDDTERNILLGKLIDGIEMVLAADEQHVDDSFAAARRLQAVRSLIHGNPYSGYVNEGAANREAYQTGLDIALSNLILADKSIALDYAQSFVDDYDNWFDFDDVDKDEVYYQQLAIIQGVNAGMPSWLSSELNVDKTDIHEVEILKDLSPMLFNERHNTRIKNYLRK